MSNTIYMSPKTATYKTKTGNKPRLGAMCKPAKCSLAIELRQKKSELKEANLELAAQKARIKDLEERLDKTEGLLRLREQALFGSKSEKLDEAHKISDVEPQEEESDESVEDSSSKGNTRRQRGAQPGHKGHGRKIPKNLPVEVVTHEIPENEDVCPRCGKPYTESGLCEESYEITMEIKVSVIKHQRKRVFRTCDCKDLPVSNTAPTPPKIIPKGKYSHSLLAYLLSFKYGFQIPLYRITLMLAQEGLEINRGTITGIFKKLQTILLSLYMLFQHHLQQEEYLHVDETGFRYFNSDKMSFTEVEAEPRKRHWLWVFCGKKVVFFVFDPSRSSAVCEKTLGLDTNASLMTDGFSAYRKYARESNVEHSLCWSHFRRFFEDAAVSFPKLKEWSDEWLARIANIYRINRTRLNSLDKPEQFANAQKELEQAIDNFYKTIKEEVQDPNLHDKQFKVLTSAISNWELYIPFVKDYRIPMDNNEAERSLRPGALGRKNWYGVHAEWSGTFTAMMMTFIQTATRHGLYSTAYLKYVLDKYAEYEGEPRNLQELLPWNIPEEICKQYNMHTGADPP